MSEHLGAGGDGRSAPSLERLSKRVASLGLASRREADVWIANGWVLVDGVVCSTLGAKVGPDQRVEVNSEARREQADRLTVLVNKPVGFVSGQAERGYRTAASLVTADHRWTGDPEPMPATRTIRSGRVTSLVPAGRLDIDSTGLLVLTDDGTVARKLIAAESTVDKEYLVRVSRTEPGELGARGLSLLRHGLELDGRLLRPAEVEWANESQLRFVLREGRKRQIRRMCALVGLEVTGLKRVRIGKVQLGALPVGAWRVLRSDESF